METTNVFYTFELEGSKFQLQNTILIFWNNFPKQQY